MSETPWYKNKPVIIIVVVIALAIAGSFIETPEASQTKETKEATNTVTTTQDKLWQIADDELHSRDGVDIKLDESTGSALVVLRNGNYFNNKDMIGSSYRHFVAIAQKAFAVDDVKRVRYESVEDFTDTDGNIKKETAVAIEMAKDEFNSVQWSNLRGSPIHTQIQSKGELYIHPAIARDVNLSEVAY